MVIGNGLIAKTFINFKKNNEVLIFASGVSKSTETDSRQFEREFKLLKESITKYPKHILVYFSTLSIEDKSVSERPYIKHKQQLESYIKNNSTQYLICRVSNVVGDRGNSNTIINYLVNAIKHQAKIDIWKNAERNIIDAEDVRYIIEQLLSRNILNKTVSIALRKSLVMIDIVSQIESHLQINVIATYINKGGKLKIDTADISKELNVIEKKSGRGVNYFAGLLKKYY